MKRLAVISLLILLSLILTACGEKPDQDIVVIKACESSLAYREYIFSSDVNSKSKEEILYRFENVYLPYLNSRTEQVFPDVETNHKLEKETHDYGDVYTLTGEAQDVIVMYIHGGAWVWEIDKLHVEFCDMLVDTLNAKVYMPIYPLAPQADYSESYAMIQQVYDELLKQDKPVIIMGDSAGGNITLGFVQQLQQAGKKLPIKVVALSPCADATFSNPDILEYCKVDGYLSPIDCLESVKLWANGADLSIPALSPINGDFTGFPDTLLFVADCDILCPDVLLLYDKMCDAKVNITLVKGEGFWHVFPIFDIEERGQCLQLIKEFCE